MISLKAAIIRVVSAMTGQSATRASLDAVIGRIDAVASAEHNISKRLKTSTDALRDRMTALERQADHDRDAILEAVGQLGKQQAQTLADLAELRRLAQRTHRALVDAEPLDEVALDREALTAHIRRAVADAPLKHEPFPYMVVPNLLPDWFYAMLLRAIPAPTFWRSAGYMRDNWHVDQDTASRLSETTWRFMHREVSAHILMPLLLDRFSDAVTTYWRDTFGLDAAELTGHYVCDEGRLLLRRAGYKLEPHLDPPNAILTVLLYLARPGDPETHGTDLYASGRLPERRTGILYPAPGH
jgi:hypothetical protein